MPLTIRWTMGDWPGRRFHDQAYSMLECSMAYARRLWPDAQLVVSTNNLTPAGEHRVASACERVGARVVAAEPWMPAKIDHGKHATSTNPNDRNPWWKLAPFRVAPDEHELVLDNDVVFWREPFAVREWLRDSSALLASGDATVTEWSDPQGYGTYSQFMRDRAPALSFASNILGWPPGMTSLPIPLAEAKTRPHYYYNEQGYLAANFVLYEGRKLLVPWSRVPAVNNNHRSRTGVLGVLEERDGAHFSDHNVGRSTRFTDEFAEILGAPWSQTPGSAPQRELRMVPLEV